MSQIELPLDDLSTPPTPSGAAEGHSVCGFSEDDVQSSEESKVEVMTQASGAARHSSPAAVHVNGKGTPRPKSIIAAWPVALTWSDALDYSSISPAQLSRWEKAGALRFRRIGRHGAKVVMRAELDRLLELTFAPAALDISEDFDFG
jgi:hypothetical protein